MRVHNPNYRSQRQRAAVDALAAYMADKEVIDFDQVRHDVPALAHAADGEIHQAALDAGLAVDVGS